MEQQKINWTESKLNRFKITFSKAVKEEQPSFRFDGHEFVTGYARYLIAYLSTKKLPYN
jgi:hypothetical protein